MMKDRGFTLVEVVISLAMLSSLAVAASTWMVTTAALDRRLSREVSEMHSVANAVALIEADVRIAMAESEPRSPVVLVRSASELAVRVVDADSDAVTSEFGLSGGTLWRRAAGEVRRELLRSVVQFSCEIDESGAWMTVELKAEGGLRHRRVVRVERREDLR